jgi:capsular polysaccharide export protein
VKVSQLQAVAGNALLSDVAECLAALRNHRVGGSYWADQPQLPDRYLLVNSNRGQTTASSEPVVRWDSGTTRDPWHMLSRASGFVGDPTSEAGVVAAILQVPVLRPAEDGQLRQVLVDPAKMLAGRLPARVVDPFTGQSMSLMELVELSGHWRRLIDANRTIVAAVGFAFWKQDSVAPLLWNGREEVAFREPALQPAPSAVAIWRAKTPAGTIARLERSGATLIEVEDGFLRSAGLGADCIPPLSIVADQRGAYFDHRAPSDLEDLLQRGDFDARLLGRAKQLRERIVAAGLGKYERGVMQLNRPAGTRRHLLVTGQVEDDRSVMTGGLGMTNQQLLERVRTAAPDAFILYKPHPDVEAGHRKGAIPAAAVARLADLVERNQPIAALLDMVDEVHVNTSLSGFEALLRGKPVTTYGVPFYGGWGLTTDYGPVPSRRSRRLTLDELVAATLLLYPRYLDPVTGLPCPAEIVVDRLCSEQPRSSGLLVASRRLQGRLRRGLRRLVA